MGLGVAVARLRDFVRIVDEKETYIDNNQRLAYRRKYTDAIEQLKTLLDDERIELIQTEKTSVKIFKEFWTAMTRRKCGMIQLVNITNERSMSIKMMIASICL